MSKSIKKNFIYNTVLRVLNIIFPLITFPYIARILSADGIGKVDFSLSVMQYFVLISQIGIPLYAIRECAKHRDDKDKLTKTVQEILIINLVMIVVSYSLFFITLISIDKFNDYNTLLLIMSINIIATNIGVEWYYEAIEEYRYIAIRSFFVKLVSLVLVFTLIRQENDYFIYGCITVFSISLGYVYNFVNFIRQIRLFKRYSNYDFKRHIKPIILLFGMNISVSVYLNLDKVLLGFLASNRSVGLYVAANRIIKVVLALVTSLGVVLLPRMSYYIENKKEPEVKRLIRKAIDFILMISLPAAVGIIFMAREIILLFAGNDYADAISTIRILSPILIAIAISNLIGIQVLMSYGKEKITLFSTVIGAVVNFILNIVLIPVLQHNGAAIAALTAEIVVVLTQVLLAYSYIKGNVNYKNIAHYLVGGLLICLSCYLIRYFNMGMLISTIVSVVVSFFVYFVYLWLVRNELVFEMYKKLSSKLRRRAA